MLLTTDEADDALNITENKTNSIKDIFFLKYCLNISKKSFLNILNGLF